MEDDFDLTTLDTTQAITMERFRQILASPAADMVCWVIVEGEMDTIAYSKFLDGSDVIVMKAGYTAKDNQVHGGKKAVQNIVSATLQENLTTNIIGIVDSDYREFEQTHTDLPPHILCTDKRDLEMSLWSITDVREALVNYLSTSPAKPIRRLTQPKLDKTLEICRYMGTIHVSNVWHGIHHQYEFKNSHYWVYRQNIFLDDATWKANLFNFYCAECSSMDNPLTFTREMLDSTIAQFDLKKRDISEFGRGHDFLGILSSVMIQTDAYNEDKLTVYMINSCTKELFSHTQLHAKIQAWQSELGLQIVA